MSFNLDDILIQDLTNFDHTATGCTVSVLREDLIHPFVSGNKYRKLKYNIQEALNNNQDTILTFGGAHSNHIAATAAATSIAGLKSIGIIRGEELIDKPLNPTLQYARSQGMQFKFITREAYRLKNEPSFITDLKRVYGDFYRIPEGGTNQLAVDGCTEIMNEATSHYDYVCVPVGTGGTVAGVAIGAKEHQHIIGFSALNGTFQLSEIKKYTSKMCVDVIDDYCLGGYAKVTNDYILFLNQFYSTYQIALDPVYTGKMMYGIQDLIKKEYFKPNSSILAIHTGGLQGIEGMNMHLKKKKLSLIEY